MTADYTRVDSELLGQMMRLAKQNPEIPAEQLEALQKAVGDRKEQLFDQLADLAKQPRNNSEAIRLNEGAQLELYNQLITLDPDNYTYYERAGKCAHFTHDYAASAAYYTLALQLLGEDIDKLCDLYQERSRAYLYAKNYSSTLADGKMFLRFKYLSPQYDDAMNKQKSYNLYMICESLRQLGQKALGDEIETTYELAELSDEGVTDELIQDYCHLLNIPLAPQEPEQATPSASTRPPLSRFTELKQQLPAEPREVKKWDLRKQFYVEYEKSHPDYAVLTQIMQEFIRFEPTNYRYPATVGGLYFKQKQYEAAIPHLTKALELVDQYPDDSWWWQHKRKKEIFRLHRMLGGIYSIERPYQTAIKHYELAIRAYPESDDTYKLMALMIQCVIYLGDGARASAMGEYYRKTFPRHPERKDIVWMEEIWADTSGGAFVEFSKVGTELGHDEHLRREVKETLDRVATPQERAEEEQQRTQKTAESLNQLEQMLRLYRAW